MALCALGLISSDATLAGAALGELMKRGNGEMKQRGLKKKEMWHSSNYGSSKSLEGSDREKFGVLNRWSHLEVRLYINADLYFPCRELDGNSVLDLNKSERPMAESKFL